MENLKELILFLDRYKVRQIEVLTNGKSGVNREENRYFECYAGIREGKWDNEEAMAAYFGLEPESKSYNRFKNEVKKRLMNSVLFIDTSLPEFSDYGRSYVTLTQQWAVGKTLAFRGANRLFIEVGFRALDVALKFECLDLIFDISSTLKARLVSYPQYQREYVRARTVFEQYHPAYMAELRIRQAYESLVFPLTTQKGLRRETARQAQALAEELAPVVEPFDYFIPQYKFRLIRIFAASNAQQWAEALALADETLDFLLRKPFELKTYRLGIMHQKANCHIMLGQYAQAHAALTESLELSGEGTTNWFKTQEMLLINGLYAADYPQAWKLLKSTVANSRFQLIPMLDQESWRLYQGYLYLLVKLGKLEISPREKGEVEKFRLSSWLNDLPLHSQDKRGANIPLLILQAIFLLQAERFDDFDNRVEAMRKYRQRNLETESEHVRTDYFIRLFELLPKHSYRPGAISIAAGPWLERMEQVSIDLMHGAVEIEVLPYERLWSWIMEILGADGDRS